MTRAAIYVRISDDREGLAVGVKRQEADCRALVEQRPGWEVTEVYDDNDISATNRRKVRPAYRRMLDDLREARVDALVAYRSSRFHRRTRELDQLIDLVEDRRVEIATVVSGMPSMSMGGRVSSPRAPAISTRSTGRRRRSPRRCTTGRRPVGCIYSVHPREQGIWTWGRTRVRPVEGAGDSPTHQTAPSYEVEREALRVSPRVLNRTRPSRAVVAQWGTRPPSHELPVRLERHQVSGPISISAPLSLFRHYWVLISILLTVIATVVLLVETQVINSIGDMAADPTTSAEDLRTLVHSVGATVMLLVILVLNTYKPQGMTRYG
jgi:Resolvase, N terminal domain